MIKQVLLVAIGGGVGSVLRFLISEISSKYYYQSFPLATLLVNILGCFLIGVFVNQLSDSINMKFLLIAGFCGGFTTFSSFARENIDLLQSNQLGLALAYTLASCVLGIFSVWLGMVLTK